MEGRARWEYLQAIHGRYRAATRREKSQILDEFCQVTGYHRKYALRRLNGPPPGTTPPRRRPRAVTYGPEVIQALRVIWEAAGYPWSVRLQALLPFWLPWARRRLRLSASLCQQLRRLSPRQMDRRLGPVKRTLKTRRYGRTKPGTLLKHHIPIKTDRWDVAVPGYTETDLVAHAGGRGDGEFAHSLNVTDIHTTWNETRAVLGRGERAVQAALDEIRQGLPFRLAALTPITAASSSTITCTDTVRRTRSSSPGGGRTRRTTMPTSSRRTGPTSASSWGTTGMTPPPRWRSSERD